MQPLWKRCWIHGQDLDCVVLFCDRAHCLLICPVLIHVRCAKLCLCAVQLCNLWILRRRVDRWMNRVHRALSRLDYVSSPICSENGRVSGAIDAPSTVEAYQIWMRHLHTRKHSRQMNMKVSFTYMQAVEAYQIWMRHLHTCKESRQISVKAYRPSIKDSKL